MIKCSRCKKRLAVIFVTKVDGGEKKTEGYCLHCASELGLPIKGVLGPNAEKLGLSTDQLIDMEDEMNNAMSSFPMKTEMTVTELPQSATTAEHHRLTS